MFVIAGDTGGAHEPERNERDAGDDPDVVTVSHRGAS
jgi:hypothetical protein